MINDLIELGGLVGRLSVDELIDAQSKIPAPFSASADHKGRLLKTVEIIAHYGNPGDPDHLVAIEVPYPFRLAWDPSHPAKKITCHKKVAPIFLEVFNDLLSHYGAAKLIELGIDLFGGLYNFRPQRGLERKYDDAISAKNFALAYSYLSRHAWAIAIDLDPARNSLKVKLKNAQFGKPEYQAMHDIFYKHGFIGYGWERDNDAMHFEIGLLL